MAEYQSLVDVAVTWAGLIGIALFMIGASVFTVIYCWAQLRVLLRLIRGTN